MTRRSHGKTNIPYLWPSKLPLLILINIEKMTTEKQVIVTEALPESGSPSDQDSSPERYTYGANRDLSSNKSFFSWFDPNDNPAERRLVQKLDFFILTYAFVGFWV